MRYYIGLIHKDADSAMVCHSLTFRVCGDRCHEFR